MKLHVLDSDLSFDTWLHRDRCDLLYCICWRPQIYQTLVDTHFKPVPSVRSLATWGLTGSDAQSLCWHSDRALGIEPLFLGTVDQVEAHCTGRK